jgi:hypothetical protein
MTQTDDDGDQCREGLINKIDSLFTIGSPVEYHCVRTTVQGQRKVETSHVLPSLLPYFRVTPNGIFVLRIVTNP